jgi:flagellar FliL protein
VLTFQKIRKDSPAMATKKPAKEEEEKKDAAPAEGAEAEVKPLDDEAGGSKLNIKKILIFALPVLLLGIGAALYFTGIIGGKKAEEGEKTAAHGSAEAGSKEGGEHGEGKTGESQFLDLPDLLVNLSGTGGGQQRFLRLKVKLEVNSPEDMKALTAVAPRVVDQFQTFLREMRIQDLRGSAGIYRLRQELLYRVNLAAQPAKVKDVLFQEMLIQ